MPCECGSSTVKLSFTDKGVDLICHACGAKLGEIDEGFDREDKAMEKMKVVVRKDLGGPHDAGETIKFETDRRAIMEVYFNVNGKQAMFSLNAYPDGTLKLFRFEGGKGQRVYDARWNEEVNTA